jgi:hypothetical protein
MQRRRTRWCCVPCAHVCDACCRHQAACCGAIAMLASMQRLHSTQPGAFSRRHTHAYMTHGTTLASMPAQRRNMQTDDIVIVLFHMHICVAASTLACAAGQRWCQQSVHMHAPMQRRPRSISKASTHTHTHVHAHTHTNVHACACAHTHTHTHTRTHARTHTHIHTHHAKHPPPPRTSQLTGPHVPALAGKVVRQAHWCEKV